MNTIPVRKRPPRSEAQVDEALEESFPASDPPSYARTARDGGPARNVRQRATDASKPGKASKQEDAT